MVGNSQVDWRMLDATAVFSSHAQNSGIAIGIRFLCRMMSLRKRLNQKYAIQRPAVMIPTHSSRDANPVTMAAAFLVSQYVVFLLDWR